MLQPILILYHFKDYLQDVNSLNLETHRYIECPRIVLNFLINTQNV